jgi:hypothetical protein
MGAVQESHVGFQYCRDIVNRKKHTYKNEAIERLRIEMQSILDRNFPSYYAKNIRGTWI